MIDEATRFHMAEVVLNQSPATLYEAILRGWIRWAGPPRFVLVDPHRSQIAFAFVENLGTQGTTVLAGAAEAHWTRGLVERHGTYLREMVAKMELDGLPPELSVQAVIDRALAAKSMMSRILGYSPAQWVLATQPRIPESLMTDEDDVDHVPFRDMPESADDEFARVVQVRDAARRAFIAVDTDARIRVALAGRSRPGRLTFKTGGLVYFFRKQGVQD